MNREERLFSLLFNGHALSGHDGQYTIIKGQPQEIQKDLLSLPFLVTSLPRINKYTYTKAYKPANTQGYSQEHRKLFKEITCQSNGKDSFTQVTDNLSDKFSTRFINDFHQFKFIIQQGICQENSYRGGQ